MKTFARRITAALAVSLSLAAVAVTPAPARPSAPAVMVPGAWLRLDDTVYAPTGCLRPVLHASVIASHGGVVAHVLSRASRDAELVPLHERPAGSGVFAPSACLRLERGRAVPHDGRLQVGPGEALVAIAVQGKRLAAADLATVAAGEGRGRFTARIAAGILPAAERALGAAAVEGPDGMRTFFARDEVIFQETRPGDLRAFLARSGGHVVGTLRIPSTETGTPSTPAGPADAYRLVRVDPAKLDRSGFEHVVEAGTTTKGTWRFSSAGAEALLAFVLREQAGATLVTVDPLLEPESAPLSKEGTSANSGSDAFMQNAPGGGEQWYGPTNPVRAGQALTLLDVMDHPSKGVTTVAIIDGGFASPADYGKSTTEPDFGAQFSVIPQCSVDDSGSSTCTFGASDAAGQSPMKCTGGAPCPWHGTEMFSVAGSRLDNGSGTSGVGALTLSPMFMKVAKSYLFPAAYAITLASSGFPWGVGIAKARVISMSNGFQCRPLASFALLNVCNGWVVSAATLVCLAHLGWGLPPWVLGAIKALGCDAVLELIDVLRGKSAIEGAISTAVGVYDVAVVASAGNAQPNDPPRDVSSAIQIPCTVDEVICVGNLDTTPAPAGASGRSNFGSRVNIWAPGTSVPAMDLPGGPNAQSRSYSGTSQATAFVAGALSIVRAVDPALKVAQARQLLYDSACYPGHVARFGGGTCSPAPAGDRAAVGGPTGGGYVDVLDLVRRARDSLAQKPPSLGTCDGGWESFDAGAGNDSPLSATPLPPSPLAFQGNAAASLSSPDEFAIHSLPQPGPGDVDWYSFTLAKPAPNAPRFRYADVTIPVPDPSLGTLKVELYAPNGANPTLLGATRQTDSTSGIALFVAALEGGKSYLVKVSAVGAVATDDNCYGTVTVTVRDAAPDPFDNPSIPPPPKVPASVGISCPLGVPLGAPATISGTLAPPRPGGSVTISYSGPAGAAASHPAAVGPDGSFGDSFTAGAPGTWTAQAHWPGDGTTLPADSLPCSFLVG